MIAGNLLLFWMLRFARSNCCWHNRVGITNSGFLFGEILFVFGSLPFSSYHFQFYKGDNSLCLWFLCLTMARHTIVALPEIAVQNRTAVCKVKLKLYITLPLVCVLALLLSSAGLSRSISFVSSIIISMSRSASSSVSNSSSTLIFYSETQSFALSWASSWVTKQSMWNSRKETMVKKSSTTCQTSPLVPSKMQHWWKALPQTAWPWRNRSTQLEERDLLKPQPK